MVGSSYSSDRKEASLGSTSGCSTGRWACQSGLYGLPWGGAGLKWQEGGEILEKGDWTAWSG